MDDKKIFYDLLVSTLGHPYQWGGSGLSGFDCSGHVCFALQAMGVVPNKYRTTSQGLYNRLIKDARPDQDIGLGTIAFYGEGKTKIRHCGIMLNTEFMIEAAGGDSSTLFLQDAKKANALVRIRPYHYRKDFICFLTHSFFRGFRD